MASLSRATPSASFPAAPAPPRTARESCASRSKSGAANPGCRRFPAGVRGSPPRLPHARMGAVFSAVLLIIFTAQFYWVFRIRAFLRRKIANRARRITTGSLLGALYLFLLAYNFGVIGPRYTPV